MRTAVNNLVTTASAAHLPDQHETLHMIHMLMKESCSGDIDDLAHVRTEFCLPYCLTKHSAKPDALIRAIGTGLLPLVDSHPPFRELIHHRAYWSQWLHEHLQQPRSPFTFMSETFERVPASPQLET